MINTLIINDSMIHENLRGEIQKALKDRDAVALRTMRSLLASLTNEAVSIGKTPQYILNDDEVIVVIKRLAKQRKDSIEQFKSGGRDDLVKIEEEELEYLSKYLPEMMSKEEILNIAKSKKEELKIDDIAKIGMLVGAVMKETKGKADGNLVKEVLESLF